MAATTHAKNTHNKMGARWHSWYGDGLQAEQQKNHGPIPSRDKRLSSTLKHLDSFKDSPSIPFHANGGSFLGSTAAAT
jgi:hypothetical protein